MTGIIAIDFGTARTKVAYRHPHKGVIELMRLGKDERPYIPSLFYLGSDGRRLFGDEAAEYLDADPLGFLPRPLKRELREPWVRAGNRVKATPTELLTLLFQGLRQRAGEIACFHHALPDSLVLTVPAQYGPPDKDILSAAARNAGFRDEGISFVDEPIAAAQAWLAELGAAEEYIVVLDCGGGTIDWACLHRTGAGRFEMVPDLPAGGDNRVGGFDIDEALFAFIEDALSDEAARDALHTARSQVLDQIRSLKEKHSRTGLGGKIRVDRAVVDISPETIEDIVGRRFISQTCQNLCSYLAKVRDKLKIDTPTVLLVGGSARIRGFKDAIEQQGRCRAVWWERSEYATVLGALQPREGSEIHPSRGHLVYDISEQDFDKLKLNMSLKEVISILGYPSMSGLSQAGADLDYYTGFAAWESNFRQISILSFWKDGQAQSFELMVDEVCKKGIYFTEEAASQAPLTPAASNSAPQCSLPPIRRPPLSVIGIIMPSEDRVRGAEVIGFSHEDAPAKQAGMIAGDVITAIGAMPINSADECIAVISNTKPGTLLSITIVRNRLPLHIRVHTISP